MERHRRRRTQINEEPTPLARRTQVNEEPAPIARRTQVNGEPAPIARRTQINGEPAPIARRTQVNEVAAPIPAPAASGDVQAGEQVAEGLTVLGRLNVGESGEADLFLCSYYGSQVVMKLYRRDKDKLLEGKRALNQALSQITNGCVVQILDSGVFHDRYYEVMPDYDQYGSMEDMLNRRTLSLKEIEEWVVPNMVTALETIHANGIFHRDIKPENIMIDNNGKTLALIDFGVAHLGEHTIMVTTVGGTSEYMAPEVYNRIFLPESDYYALGVTLYKLFMGSTPFSNMNEESALQTAVLGEIPRPDRMPARLHDLIAALTYKDLSHRSDKSNPNRRWKAEEVQAWLRKEKYVVPGRSRGRSEQPAKPLLTRAATFNKRQFTDPDELLKQMAIDWEEGKAYLNRRELFQALSRNNDARIASRLWQMQSFVDNAEEEDIDEPEDVFYFRFLNEFVANDGHFYWVTGAYESLQSFGDELLRALLEHIDGFRISEAKGEERSEKLDFPNDLPDYVNVVKYNLAGLHLEQLPEDRRPPETEALIGQLQTLSEQFNKTLLNHHELFSYAYLIAQSRIYLWRKHLFHSADELKRFFVKQRNEGVMTLMETLHGMHGSDGGLLPDLDAWLTSQQTR